MLCQRWWEPFWEAGHPKTPGLWLEYGPWQPILGGVECPTAQRPGHAQSGQRRLACLWLQLATEVPLLVPLSLSTGCHCSECAVPLETLLGLKLITCLGSGVWRLEGERVKGRGKRDHSRQAICPPPRNQTLHPLLPEEPHLQRLI